MPQQQQQMQQMQQMQPHPAQQPGPGAANSMDSLMACARERGETARFVGRSVSVWNRLESSAIVGLDVETGTYFSSAFPNGRLALTVDDASCRVRREGGTLLPIVRLAGGALAKRVPRRRTQVARADREGAGGGGAEHPGPQRGTGGVRGVTRNLVRGFDRHVIQHINRADRLGKRGIGFRGEPSWRPMDGM